MIIGQTSEMYLCQQVTGSTYGDEQLCSIVEQNVISQVPANCEIRSIHWQSMNPNDVLPLDQCERVMFVVIYEQVKW